jgi:RNA polymerase sigma-70 factor (ECF subfamily)
MDNGSLDPATLAAFHAAEEVVFGRLMAKYDSELSRYCRRYGRSQDDKDELVQLTWILIWEKRQQYRGSGSILGWMQRLARTVCLRGVASSHQVRLVALDGIEPVAGPTPLDSASAIETQAIEDDRLSSVLALPPRQRRMILARYCLSLSTKQAAEMFGCAPGTVKATLSQAVAALRRADYEKRLIAEYGDKPIGCEGRTRRRRDSRTPSDQDLRT